MDSARHGDERPITACMPGWEQRVPPRPPYAIGVLPGQGVGPEVIGAARSVLDAVSDAFGLVVELRDAPDIGSPGRFGPVLTAEMAEWFTSVFADGWPVLCGPVSGRFVYELRAALELFCKLTPIRPSPALADAAIVRRVEPDVDIMIVRDNSAGLYLGEFGRRQHGRVAYQQLTYSAEQVDRIIDVAVRAARNRRGRLAVVTKTGGIPEVSALWLERAGLVCDDQGVAVTAIEVDNACFQVVAHPQQFDVMVAPNMLGDVVGDAAALVLGSRGMALSGNFGSDGRAAYQTAHGAAYALAGRDEANPVAQILSLAMLLRESLGLLDAARAVEDAVESVLASGLRTVDVAGPESTVVGGAEFAARVAATVGTIPASAPSP
jgi:3-isopropylmalate dehydrogenase